MNKIKYILAAAATLILSAPAQAAVDTQQLISPAGLIDLALLLCVIICLFWAVKVISLVRGGLMAKGWQMFAAGFIVLLIARLLSIGESISLLQLPGYIFTALYLLMAFTWLLGLYRTKKVLG